MSRNLKSTIKKQRLQCEMRVDKKVTRTNVAAANDALLLLLLHNNMYVCALCSAAIMRRLSNNATQGAIAVLSRFCCCCCCTPTSRRFTLVSCSRDVFIRPEPLRVVLANNIISYCSVRSPKNQTQSKKVGRCGPLWAILGPVFFQVYYFWGSGE